MANKRSRYRESSSEEETSASSEEEKTPSKRSRRATAEEVEMAEGDVQEIEEDEEEEDLDIAAAEWESNRTKEMGKGKGKVGATAEAGVIDSVELIDFMCHKYLTINFGPKINFIVGHNGSGKSAILTGITVCLGGKANTTNRASNLKSLIREGANAAQVTVKLRNEGPDAHNPEVYGKSIIIERRISRDGTSGYKIKNAEGRQISTKRDELTSILDHMSIQVDNPINVLSQDTARQFLQSSSSEDKYKFFMKGTQLTQLSEDYELIRESIDTSSNIIKRKKEILPELHKAAKEAEDRFKNMKKARELEASLERLKQEMAWAQVEEVEQIVEEVEKQLEMARRRVSRTRTNFDEANADLEAINQEVASIENELHAQAERTRPLREKKKELRKSIQEKKEQMREIFNEIKELNETIKRLKQKVEQYDRKIEEETKKIESTNRQRRDETLATIGRKELQLENIEKEQQRLRAEVKEYEESIGHVNRQKSMIGDQLTRAQKDVQSHKTLLDQLHDQKKNRLSVFGANIDKVIDAIRLETRFHHPPIGPLGQFITLNEQKWANTLESVLGRLLGAFAVQDYHDQRILGGIMRKYSCNQPIIISVDDVFDYTSGEPDPSFTTILRVLKFENERVKRLLINERHIERSILVEERAQADIIMRNDGKGFPYNVDACFTLHGFQVGNKGGGYSTQALNSYRGPSRFRKDVEEQLRDAKKNLDDAAAHESRLKNELARGDSELRNLNTKKESAKTRARDSFTKVNRLNNEIQQLKAELQEEEPANIAALEEAKSGAEQEIEMYVRQYQEIEEQREELSQECNSLTLEGKEIQQQLQDIVEDNDLRTNFEQKVALRLEGHNKKVHWEGKLSKEQEKLGQAGARLEEEHGKLENITNRAQEYCPVRVEVTMDPKSLDRKIKNIQAKLLEREKEQGASVEELTLAMKSRQEAYVNAKTEITNVDKLIKELQVALEHRMHRWHQFRTYIALRARINFLRQLSKRGFTGKLIFDHRERKLDIRILVDEQLEKGAHKDPRCLSGGEKSFSTICLLLSLWEAMGCPIRCLDEFDVFMDAVNRRISMKMMTDAARESDCIQYILITPQDASNVLPGPDVRINRLQDPERGQATLTSP